MNSYIKSLVLFLSVLAASQAQAVVYRNDIYAKEVTLPDGSKQTWYRFLSFDFHAGRYDGTTRRNEQSQILNVLKACRHANHAVSVEDIGTPMPHHIGYKNLMSAKADFAQVIFDSEKNHINSRLKLIGQDTMLWQLVSLLKSHGIEVTNREMRQASSSSSNDYIIEQNRPLIIADLRQTAEEIRNLSCKYPNALNRVHKDVMQGQFENIIKKQPQYVKDLYLSKQELREIEVAQSTMMDAFVLLDIARFDQEKRRYGFLLYGGKHLKGLADGKYYSAYALLTSMGYKFIKTCGPNQVEAESAHDPRARAIVENGRNLEQDFMPYMPKQSGYHATAAALPITLTIPACAYSAVSSATPPLVARLDLLFALRKLADISEAQLKNLVENISHEELQKYMVSLNEMLKIVLDRGEYAYFMAFMDQLKKAKNDRLCVQLIKSKQRAASRRLYEKEAEEAIEKLTASQLKQAQAVIDALLDATKPKAKAAIVRPAAKPTAPRVQQPARPAVQVKQPVKAPQPKVQPKKVQPAKAPAPAIKPVAKPAAPAQNKKPAFAQISTRAAAAVATAQRPNIAAKKPTQHHYWARR